MLTVSCSAPQALGVSAGADSQAVQQISSRPLRETDSALAWPAILGIVLGSIILLTLCGAVFARKFTRRIYKACYGPAGIPGPMCVEKSTDQVCAA